MPTLCELGYYPNWYGSARAIVAPAGTPDDVIEIYVNAYRKTKEDPERIEQHKKAGLTMSFMDNKELGELIKKQEVFCRDEISQRYK